jgi:phage terminase small subunit
VAKREQVDDDGLTRRQRLFCLALLANGGDGAAAAREAGYSPKAAAQQAHENLQKPAIKRFLEPKLAKQVKRLELAAERLDEELARCAYSDIGEVEDPATFRIYSSLRAIPEDTRRAVQSVKVRIAKVLVGKEARAEAARLMVDTTAPDGTEREVLEVQLGTVEVKLAPKVEAIMGANKVLGRLKDKLEVTGKFSHEQLLILAAKIRERRRADPAGRAGPGVGGKPAASARGGRP